MWRLLPILWLALAAISLGAAPSAEVTPKAGNRVLLLTGPDASEERLIAIRRAAERVFAKSPDPVRLARMKLPPTGPRDTQFRRIQTLLKRDPALILAALDDTALYFLLRHHAQLPKTARIVFGDCVYGRVFPQYLYQNVTGTLNAGSADELTRLGLRLFPGTRKILAVTPNSTCGRLMVEQLNQTKKDLNFSDFRILTSRPGQPEELDELISRLGPDALIVHCGFIAGASDGERYEQPVGGSLGPTAAPVVAMNNFGIGRGTVLGYAVPPKDVGNALGECILQLLNGKTPSELPVGLLRPKVTVDRAKLQLWRIPTSRLPSEYNILGVAPRTEELRGKIRKHTPLIILALGFLVLFIGLLLLLVMRDQKRAHQQQKLTELFGSLPVGFVLLTPQLRVEYRHGLDPETISDDIIQSALRRAMPEVEKILKNGHPRTLDLYIDGLRWAGELFRYCPDNENDHGELLWVLQEVSLRESRERLAENEAERLAGLLDAIDNALFCIDEGGRITYLNPAAETLTGVARTQALQQPLDEVLRLENLLTGKCGGRTVLYRRKHDYCAIRSKNGIRRVCRITVHPLTLAEWQGELIAVTEMTLENRLREKLLHDYADQARLLGMARLAYFRRGVGGAAPEFPAGNTPWGVKSDGTLLPAPQWVVPEDLPNFLNLWDKLESRRISEDELIYRAVNGRRYWMRVSFAADQTFSGVIADLGRC